MINEINTDHNNIVAFKFTEEVTGKDLDIVLERVKKQVECFDYLNLVYVIDTDLSKFTAEAWFKDAQLGIKNLLNWERCAIVTKKEAVQKFTDAFSAVAPGNFKGFDRKHLQEALDWAAKGGIEKE